MRDVYREKYRKKVDAPTDKPKGQRGYMTRVWRPDELEKQNELSTQVDRPITCRPGV